ncbi:FlgD immunoglobulin-like domain containing protein, partial [Candidatus Marinimicrobia bacterium]|nr:FlgD immunoglobulin-like domain containing protein [Candidatus Neomarinimicrobiota bacterium]
MRRFTLYALLITKLISQELNQSALTLNNNLSYKDDLRYHLTPFLLEIAKNGKSFSSEKKHKLESLGFDFNMPLVSRKSVKRSESDGLDKSYDSGIIRFHYTTSGYHAVNNSDINGNSIPDYVDSVAMIFNNVTNLLHNKMGYFQPPSDGYYSSDRDKGGSEHYDVYIRNLSSRYYGYVQPEEFAQSTGDNEKSISRKEKNAFTSYMVMRNNYKNFPLEELMNIKVTIAHEYYHAIQFGYDGWEKPWLLESSAVWMEEEIYDEINDCYQYMEEWFNFPHRSLDESGYHWYGSFIFFEYIEQHMGGNSTIRKILDQSAISDSREIDGSHLAIDNALNKLGYSFQQALNGMSIANFIMSSQSNSGDFSYEEAESYPVNRPAILQKINFEMGNVDTIKSISLSRFGSEYIQIFSTTPVQIDLKNISGPFSDIQMNSIITKNDESYLILSTPSINIDPLDIKSIHLSIVSQDSLSNNWDYNIIIRDGKSGTNSNVPMDFNLSNPYPNPFNGLIKFSVYMLRDTRITIDVYDITGRKVDQLYNDKLNSGNHNFTWHGKNIAKNKLSSGIYYIKVATE